MAAPGVAAYACSKAALWMLVRVLADELRADGINVNEFARRGANDAGPLPAARGGAPGGAAGR